MTPRFKILANSEDISDLIDNRLLSLSITDEIGLVSDSLTMELDDRDMVFEFPPRGAELEAFLGYDDLYPMGKFIVDEVELSGLPHKMIITARAADSTMGDAAEFKAPRSYSWEKYTLLGIVQAIAQRYGLKESVDSNFHKIQIDHIDQTDESDAAFIQRLAQDYGAIVKIANGTLLFIQPLRGCFPNGSPLPTIGIPITDLSSYQMRLAERGKYGKVIAKYYDFGAAEEKQVSVGTGSPTFSMRDTYISEEQAKLRAKGKMAEIESGIQTLSAEMVGNPMIAAESKIELTEVRAEVAGEWIIKSVRHNLSASGYKTTIEATRILK